MQQIRIERLLNDFLCYLEKEERSRATIEKYIRDVRKFYCFTGNKEVIDKDTVIEYKEYLEKNYKLSSANSMIAALNCFLTWMGLENCRVRSFKRQKEIFCSKDSELSREEYIRLVHVARETGQERLELIMQTICGTGIRISELLFITIEAVKHGRSDVRCKGKQRTIFLPPKLQKYLLLYCKKKQIRSGPVFITRNGEAVKRENVWAEMKALCEKAKVSREKVYPHNLRHLFARICYKQKKDIVYLADILGHSSIETTRIYTVSSGEEHRKILEGLRLII